MINAASCFFYLLFSFYNNNSFPLEMISTKDILRYVSEVRVISDQKKSVVEKYIKEHDLIYLKKNTALFVYQADFKKSEVRSEI